MNSNTSPGIPDSSTIDESNSEGKEVQNGGASEIQSAKINGWNADGSMNKEKNISKENSSTPTPTSTSTPVLLQISNANEKTTKEKLASFIKNWCCTDQSYLIEDILVQKFNRFSNYIFNIPLKVLMVVEGLKLYDDKFQKNNIDVKY
ncbi:uncharacterized protein ASCRUDRAFT_68230 [Ascoidea rubescens DSM 1968]|uniref:Uncharacterized protein n=1 Tax=Ascoidea rubescens DSM 1968 TaxID=1344418 RepID=A0A1D2VRJ8_9ASCO|nr:hypothetical protein ASCRUDRAFT_68230 [Ascoidea rubescens DSM 1968]ODV64220.1 hypothetical protein ASCRUDRAFT_68230 [Ascoidea rubescens DSM 1968]